MSKPSSPTSYFLPNCGLHVTPFYGDNDHWHKILGSGRLSNFYPLPVPISITYKGISATYSTTEAAYQSLKWFDNDSIRKEFELAKDGQEAFDIKLKHESQTPMVATWSDMKIDISENVNKWTGMKLVLQSKFAIPEMRDYLLGTGTAFLTERNAVRGRDTVWSDNVDGTGGNWLGRVLMDLRGELDPSLKIDVTKNCALWADSNLKIAIGLKEIEKDVVGEIVWDDNFYQFPGEAGPTIVGLENALVDLTAGVDDIFVAEWGIIEGGTIHLDSEKYKKFVAAVTKRGGIKVPGGCTQNSIRVASWILRGTDKRCGFIGFAAGGDTGRDLLISKMSDSGVVARYAIDIESDTNLVSVLIPPSKERSLVFSKGAPSEYFCEKYSDRVLLDEKSMELLQNAHILYSSGWFTFLAPAMLRDVAKSHISKDKIFAFNLAGKYVISSPKFDELMSLIVIANYIIGSESEFDGLAEAFKIETEGPPSVAAARHIFGKTERKGKCVVIMTRGERSTFIIDTDGSEIEIEVEKLSHDEITDTTGAGDAFAGGFLAGISLGKPLNVSVEAGHFCARQVLKNRGCSVSPAAEFFNWN